MNKNEMGRQAWLKRALSEIPPGLRILDAGAGELKNQKYCRHLEYVSQDFCEYSPVELPEEGLHNRAWDTGSVDIVSDIVAIPAGDASFDAILCSEVLEHIPEPTHALDEFARLLKPGGKLVLTAPFSSNVHMAPYYFCTGFSRYWYKYHLPKRGFEILELTPNGDWYTLLGQELRRLGGLERRYGSLFWPASYVVAFLVQAYVSARRSKARSADLACFGWHCVAAKVKN